MIQDPAVARAGFKSTADVAILTGLLMLCVVALLWDAILVSVMVSLRMDDFGRFYYSARAFLAGTDMYAPTVATQLGAGQTAAGPQLLNLNPPHFHLLLLPLARLEPGLAVSWWMIASLGALVRSILIIGREVALVPTPKRVLSVVLFVLVCSPSQAVFITGQVAFVLLLPMTLCWRDARAGRWGRAGVWLGVLLSVKPFLLILVPVLIRHRQWRACAVTATTTVACFAAGVMVFGLPNYVSWIAALRHSADWAWLGMNVSAFGAFQRAFRASPAFMPLVISPGLAGGWIAVAGVIGFGTWLVLFLNNNTKFDIDRAFALLLVGAQLLSPVGWVYYLWLAAGPIAALASGRELNPSPRSMNGVLAGIGFAGLLTPITAPYFFQPARWATVSLGSVYFWSALALWGCLVLGVTRGRADFLFPEPPTSI